MKSQLLQESRQALELHNFSEALQKTQQLIALDPGDHQSYLLYGDIFMEMENGTKAIEHYERGLAIRSDDASAFFKLGNAYEMKEDYQNALQQYKTARRLEPDNSLYAAYTGRALNRQGIESGNVNYENEGLGLMEQAFQAGITDANLREQLAIAHLTQAISHWPKHPEQEGYFVATELVHLQHTKAHLEWVTNLYDRSNQAITQRVAEIEGFVRDMEKRQFAGYPYLRKVPFIVGVMFGLFGQVFLGITMLAMGVLYHFSQYQPGYLANRMLFKGNYRPPFIVRRLDQMDNVLSGITIYSNSLSNLFLNKFLFNLVFGATRFGMVLVVLPYEIIKGFMANYGLKDQLMAKAQA